MATNEPITLVRPEEDPGYEEIDSMKLPNGTEMRMFNDRLTGSSFCVDERDGQTIQSKLWQSRAGFKYAPMPEHGVE